MTTTYTWPAPPAPGSTVRGEFWTYTTDEEGYWGAYHQHRPDRRQPVSTSPLNAIHAHGPFQVTAPDGTEYTLAIPGAPAVGTRLQGAKTGRIYELTGGTEGGIHANLRADDNVGREWFTVLKEEGSLTVVSSPDATRYEVREDPEVDPRALANYPDQRYCVWDTQTDSAYRDRSTANGAAFVQVTRESAQQMADFLNAGPVEIHEDNSGAVYLTRHGVTWALGPVTADMDGQAARTAWAWCAGDWEPNESDGQSPASTEDLDLIAIWNTDGTLIIEKNPHGEPVAGAGGAAFLGIEKP